MKKILLTLLFSFLIFPSFSFAQGTGGGTGGNTIDYICNGGSANGFGTAGGVWDNNDAALAGCNTACVGGTCSPVSSQHTCPTGQTWDSVINACALGTVVVTPPLPSTTSGLIPCGTIRAGAGSPVSNSCGFKDLLTLINNFVKFILFVLAVPIAALMFIYAGFEMVTSGGSSEKATKAKNIFTNAVIGIALAAASWLIVELILTTLGYDGSWIGF